MPEGKFPATGIGIHDANSIEKLHADFYMHKHDRATHERFNTLLRDDFVVPLGNTQSQFQLTDSPYGSGFILVFLNGLLQKDGDSYSINGNTITFTTPRGENEYITAIYKPCWSERDNTVSSNNQSDFSIAPDINIINAVYILTFRNGLLQLEDVDYVLGPTDVSFLDPLTADQYVSLLYRPNWTVRDDFVTINGDDRFELTQQSASCAVMIYRNGLIQWPGADYIYSEEENEVVFTSPMGDGEFVTAIYRI